MCIQLHAIGRLIKRTVEGGDEEHEHLGSHTQEEEKVGTWQVGQFEECT